MPDALLKLAMSLERLGAQAQACATFTKLFDRLSACAADRAGYGPDRAGSGWMLMRPPGSLPEPEQAWRDLAADLSAYTHLLLAVSGGPDSPGHAGRSGTLAGRRTAGGGPSGRGPSTMACGLRAPRKRAWWRPPAIASGSRIAQFRLDGGAGWGEICKAGRDRSATKPWPVCWTIGRPMGGRRS